MEKYRQRCRDFFSGLWPAEEKVLVFGEGQSDHPPVMLIGEAPGEQETLQRRPFVGKAGTNLDGFLEAVALRREEIYISNVVKVRPTKVSARGSVSNRPPNREELALFTPWLLREIDLVAPQVIATLGNVPLFAVTGDRRLTIGEAHGRVMEAGETGRRLFALYHPASLIYNRSLEPVYEQDVCTLAAWIDRDARGAVLSGAKTDI